MLEKVFFFGLTGAYIIIWGKILWYLSERSRLVKNLVMKIMTVSTSSNAVIKSKILSVIYFFYSIIGFVLLAIISGRGILSLFSFTILTIPLALFGFLTQIMIISLVLGVFLPILRKKVSSRITEEVGESPWILGISEMRNPFLITIVPGISGFFEEMFFRGAFLYALTNILCINLWVSIVIVTIAFLIQQVLQLTNPGQIIIIGISCIIISVTGSWMVLSSGSIFPAALAHSVYAIFYVRLSNRNS